MIERGGAGVYNAAGPDYALTMGQLLDECGQVSRSGARVTWVDERFLLGAGVKPWSDLPLWLPEEGSDEHRYFLSVNCERAVAAGLTFRPLAETIRDTLAWDDNARSRGEVLDKDYGVHVPESGLRPERERELLRGWHGRR
ncbi:MAG: hypothetical protein ACRD68_00735 [Pyrinomonadaceae bacterium]